MPETLGNFQSLPRAAFTAVKASHVGLGQDRSFVLKWTDGLLHPNGFHIRVVQLVVAVVGWLLKIGSTNQEAYKFWSPTIFFSTLD